MDLGLTQKALAGQLGVDEDTIAHWVTGRTTPALCHLPYILNWLGHDPRAKPTNIGEALKHYRSRHGLSQKQLAGRLAVDPGTLARWERGECVPTGKCLQRPIGLVAR